MCREVNICDVICTGNLNGGEHSGGGGAGGSGKKRGKKQRESFIVQKYYVRFCPPVCLSLLFLIGLWCGALSPPWESHVLNGGQLCRRRRRLAGLNHCSESFPPLLIRREWNLSIFLYLGDREQSRIVLQIVCAWFFASPGTTWKGMGPRNCSGVVKVAGEQWTASLRSRNMRKIEKERHHSSGSSN